MRDRLLRPPHHPHPTYHAFAQSGTRFDTAVSNCPICMPARSIVISGQYARTCTGMLTNVCWPHGESEVPFAVAGMPQWPTQRRRHLPDPNFPELLQHAGYRTAAIGKWHIEAWPDAVGFDHYFIPAHHHAHTAQWICDNGQRLVAPQGYSVDAKFERVEAFLNERPNDDPFFLYYNISPPHMPLADAPLHYVGMYRRDEVIRRDNIPSAYQPTRDQILTYLWDYRYYRDRLPFTRELPHDGFDLDDLTAMYMGLVT